MPPMAPRERSRSRSPRVQPKAAAAPPPPSSAQTLPDGNNEEQVLVHQWRTRYYDTWHGKPVVWRLVHYKKEGEVFQETWVWRYLSNLRSEVPALADLTG